MSKLPILNWEKRWFEGEKKNKNLVKISCLTKERLDANINWIVSTFFIQLKSQFFVKKIKSPNVHYFTVDYNINTITYVFFSFWLIILTSNWLLEDVVTTFNIWSLERDFKCWTLLRQHLPSSKFQQSLREGYAWFDTLPEAEMLLW